jgi:hypothetical protein
MFVISADDGPEMVGLTTRALYCKFTEHEKCAASIAARFGVLNSALKIGRSPLVPQEKLKTILEGVKSKLNFMPAQLYHDTNERSPTGRNLDLDFDDIGPLTDISSVTLGEQESK